MNPQLRQQAVELTEYIMKTYYFHRDIDAVLDKLSSDASWIGPGAHEKKYFLDEIRTYFEQGRDKVPSCIVSNPDLRAVDLGEDYCLVTGSMLISTVPESQLVLEVDQRVSFTFRYIDGGFEIVHMHISNPYNAMRDDEYFPHALGSQSYRYLQRLLQEKTEVIDMIAANINGGLKGSNDDDTFSFFYVNEGLPKMLGYTYDEFMEKSGGSAVGAAYPPDLPAALEQCEKGFAEGPSYSAEYRMEKKDGSLMWVLDSGRKMVDSEGVTRINSIIMDITPLKQALFDLEIERERYRIALEHITGSMCEYDIANDTFVLYQSATKYDHKTVEKLEITNFSQKMSSGTFAAPEDSAIFLDLCTGRLTGSIELRTKLPYAENPWYWSQFSCSVIQDHTATPVRTIGILKDITEEKLRNLELLHQAQRDGLTGLLNQTATREAIQSYLVKNREPSTPAPALIIIDLDHFKEVNDFNGHLYGNEVLISTAQILTNIVPHDSVVGRIGGDEFLILIHDTEPDTVVMLASRIVEGIRKIGTDQAFGISCSVGVSYLSNEDEQYTSFFNRADKALYQAKEDGRDRFSVSL